MNGGDDDDDDEDSVYMLWQKLRELGQKCRFEWERKLNCDAVDGVKVLELGNDDANIGGVEAFYWKSDWLEVIKWFLNGFLFIRRGL